MYASIWRTCSQNIAKKQFSIRAVEFWYFIESERAFSGLGIGRISTGTYCP